MTKKYYALFDTQLDEYRQISGETLQDVAEDGANWWFDINYDSEIEDLLDRYESDEDYINELYNVSSYEEFEEKQIKKLREMDNVEYLEDKGFEIRNVSLLEYIVLNEIDYLEDTSEHGLQQACIEYKRNITLNGDV